jgi:hypothetical protein
MWSSDDKFYVYYKPGKLASDGIGDYWVFERCCGNVEQAAKDRVKELLRYYPEATYTKNETMKGAFY